MSTFTVNYTYAHTVSHVTTKMLLLLKDIIREIGLDPSSFVSDWGTNEKAVSTWLASGHLQRVTLEVYSRATAKLVTRWDMEVLYSTVGDGSLWVDTEAIRYNIVKAGVAPSGCSYDLTLRTSPGRPDVDGWGPGALRSTEGLTRYNIGATVGGNGLTSETAYWR
jgi:hypothetical protein